MEKKMTILKGNFMGAYIQIECIDLNHASMIIHNMCLDNPLRFDPINETLLLMHKLSIENKIKKLDPAFIERALQRIIGNDT
jgi:hypothetical protein